MTWEVGKVESIENELMLFLELNEQLNLRLL